nr:hypothetical protein [Tanacetum cinerariifolium]
MLHGLGEVNPTRADYNSSKTSKDNGDPRWSISSKTRRTKKTSSALEVFWKTLFYLLDEGASGSMVVDKGKQAISTALSAAVTGTGETTLDEGLKVNQRYEETINPASFRASAHMELCCIRDGSWNGFGHNRLY